MNDDYQLLDLEQSGRLLTVSINNPPVNVLTPDLVGEIGRLLQNLATDRHTTVLRWKSANPDFFLAHFDIAAILGASHASRDEALQAVRAFQGLCAQFREMDKVVIGQIEGRIGGGGAEMAACFDMRFGVRGRTRLNQMEVPLGIFPGGGGTQMLPRLVGRSRALEVILGAEDIDAETAERWGYLNRLFEADEIDSRVEALARRIASFPAASLRLAKQSINNSEKYLPEGLADEADLFVDILRTPEAKAQMEKFMSAGGQTHDTEIRIAAVSQEICESPSG